MIQYLAIVVHHINISLALISFPSPSCRVGNEPICPANVYGLLEVYAESNYLSAPANATSYGLNSSIIHTV